MAVKKASPKKPGNRSKPAKPAKRAKPTVQKGSPAKPRATKKAAGKPAPIGKKPAKAVAPETVAPKKPAARRPPGSPPIERTRVVIPMDVYEPQKDAIKAPIKAHELKWNFLGEGKGLYKRADGGVHCFTQFKDDGVHYSLWGDDKKAVGEILAAWRVLLGEEGWTRATKSGEAAAKAELVEKESEALRLWKLAQPQPRPGEPDLFLKKRLAEWQAKRPV